MNIIQTSQIKSNKMMVEKLLEKSKEKKYEEKPISCFFRTFSDTSYCCFIHENLPNIIMILEFFLFAPFICFVLFVDHFQSSIECFLSKMNSLSITHFFFSSIGSQCNSENHGTTDLQMKTTKIYGSFQFDH